MIIWWELKLYRILYLLRLKNLLSPSSFTTYLSEKKIAHIWLQRFCEAICPGNVKQTVAWRRGGNGSGSLMKWGHHPELQFLLSWKRLYRECQLCLYYDFQWNHSTVVFLLCVTLTPSKNPCLLSLLDMQRPLMMLEWNLQGKTSTGKTILTLSMEMKS